MNKGCVTLFCAFCLCTLMVSANRDAGDIDVGENLTWGLKEGTLTIRGTGKMRDMRGSIWGEYRESILRVVIEEGVTHVGAYFFYYMPNLTSASIADSVTTIGDRAFFASRALKNVTLSKNVIEIGEYAFGSCNALNTILLPNTLTAIGNAAFFESGLTSVVIPASVKSIGNVAFGVIQSLISITVDKSNKYFKSVDGVLFFRNGTHLMQYPAGNRSTSYIVPDGVEVIEGHAFRDCYSLRNIVISESVSLIQIRAFEHCSALTSVFYQGSYCVTDADSLWRVFAISPVRNVCVPPAYSSHTFCYLNVTNTSTCNAFQKLFNTCNKGSFVDDQIAPQKWKNVTDWEERTDGCVEYACSVDSGLVSRSMCNAPRKCIEGKCISEWDWDYLSGSSLVNVMTSMLLLVLATVINLSL